MRQSEQRAEAALLGCLLIDNSTLEEISGSIQPNDFSTPFHCQIFKVICDFLSEGKSADIISVAKQLSKADIDNDNDIFIQVCEIANGQFAPVNIKHYAELVKQSSTDKKILAAAQTAISSVHEQKENRLDLVQRLFTDIENITLSDIPLASDILANVIAIIDERQTSKSEITGLSTGFPNLNKITHGLHAGNLIVLAGRPSMGKTLLAMNIAEHIAIVEKQPVIVFSLEMSNKELLERSLASIGRIDAEKMKTGQLSSTDLEKVTETVTKLSGAKLFIEDRSPLSVSEIRAKCRRIKREHGLGLIIVDYISLMSDEAENETLRIANISRGLKLLARNFNVPVIAISQLNRGVEQRTNKRPCMSDLRQSGAIEQDADLVLLIYRDEVYTPTAENKAAAEIIIAKNRNGTIGSIMLSFDGRHCRFSDYTGTYLPNTKPTHTPKFNQFMYNGAHSHE